MWKKQSVKVNLYIIWSKIKPFESLYFFFFFGQKNDLVNDKTDYSTSSLSVSYTYLQFHFPSAISITETKKHSTPENYPEHAHE